MGKPAHKPRPQKGYFYRQRRHVDRPLELKWKLLRALEAGTITNQEIYDKYNISSSTLSGWKKNREAIFAAETNGMSPKVKRDRKSPANCVQRALVLWLRDVVSNRSGVSLCSSIMKEKCLR